MKNIYIAQDIVNGNKAFGFCLADSENEAKVILSNNAPEFINTVVDRLTPALDGFVFSLIKWNDDAEKICFLKEALEKLKLSEWASNDIARNDFIEDTLKKLEEMWK